MVYRTSLPENWYFSTRGLYTAPDAQTHRTKVDRDEKDADTEMDDALQKSVRQAARKFGPTEAAEAMEVERRMIDAARRRGSLVRAAQEDR